jgi:hypothetical protein
MLVYFMDIWSILRPVGIFCGQLVYFLIIWYIVYVLVCCAKKNLATLVERIRYVSKCTSLEVAGRVTGLDEF